MTHWRTIGMFVGVSFIIIYIFFLLLFVKTLAWCVSPIFYKGWQKTFIGPSCGIGGNRSIIVKKLKFHTNSCLSLFVFILDSQTRHEITQKTKHQRIRSMIIIIVHVVQNSIVPLFVYFFVVWAVWKVVKLPKFTTKHQYEWKLFTIIYVRNEI